MVNYFLKLISIFQFQIFILTNEINVDLESDVVDADMEATFHRILYGDEELELEALDPDELDTESNIADEVAEGIIKKFELIPDRKILVR